MIFDERNYYSGRIPVSPTYNLISGVSFSFEKYIISSNLNYVSYRT